MLGSCMLAELNECFDWLLPYFVTSCSIGGLNFSPVMDEQMEVTITRTCSASSQSITVPRELLCGLCILTSGSLPLFAGTIEGRT